MMTGPESPGAALQPREPAVQPTGRYNAGTMTDRADGEASLRHTRRGFLAAVGVTSVAGLTQAAPAPPGADYLFAPGLIYLNTASLGPTPRAVLDRTMEAWQQLEANPVLMAYGDGAVHVAADRTRTHAAALLDAAPTRS